MPNTLQERMEDISVAYVRAVAAKVGYTYTKVDRDNYGVDGCISCKGRPSDASTYIDPKLEVQLKSSFNAGHIELLPNGDLRYQLEVKNYKQLISSNRISPLILIVLLMPDDESLWVTHTRKYLMLKRCAYWINLKGQPETLNEETITIIIPKENVFSPKALQRIMTLIGEGKEIIL